MLYIGLLIAMIFMHIWDDYGRQGILADLKQKAWWENLPNYSEKYSKDYIVALFVHSFSWAVMIMLPLLLFVYFTAVDIYAYERLLIMFVGNVILHAYIDDAKCNRYKINLIQDQLLHLCQIVGTCTLVYCLR